MTRGDKTRILHRRNATVMRACLVSVISLQMLVFTSLGSAASSPSTSGNRPTAVALTIASTASSRCSKATAASLVKKLRLGDPEVPNPVAKVLCGSFTGPGSQTMVVSLWGPGNTGLITWAVFRWTGNAWDFLMKQPFASSITAAGSDIRQTLPIYRQGDSRCCPTGGTKTRIWHWNGKRFIHGAWKLTAPAAPAAGAFKYGYFKTPSGNIQCDYGYGGNARAYVRCGIKSGLKPASRKGPGCYPNVWVVLGPTGPATAEGSFCPGEDAPDAGPFAGAGVGRVLGYGKTWSGGGLRCTSAVAGLTCQNRSGHGFFLSREKWRRF